MTELNARAVMNHLIETCRDAEKGFRHAADLVKDPAMRSALGKIADRRAAFADTLLPHAQRLGGPAASAGTAAARVHRGWMDVRDVISGHNDTTMLAEVKRGDAITLRAYEEAVHGALPGDVRDVIEQQLAEVRAAHEYIDKVEHTTRKH